jgi:hypothetical protein
MAEFRTPFDAAFIPSFTVTRFRVQLLFGEPLGWSPLSSVVIRGALGQQLSRANEAAYDTLFKPPSAAPPPLLIQPVAAVDVPDLGAALDLFPREAGPFSFHDLRHHIYLHYRRRVAFDVVLVGSAAKRRSEFVLAQVWELQKHGLGRYLYAEGRRVPFRVERITHLGCDGVQTAIVQEDERGEAVRMWKSSTNDLPPSFGPDEALRRASTLANGSHLDISIETPMVLTRRVTRVDGKSTIVAIKQPTFAEVITKTWRRLQTLDRNYASEGSKTRAPVSRPDPDVLEAVPGRWLHHHWVDQVVSSRSPSGRSRIQGAVGACLVANQMSAVLPLLAYVEEVAVGKSTNSGMGRIRITPVNMP